MKTRTLTLELSKSTPPPAPETRRPARRRERPGFRPDVQRLEPRISLSALVGSATQDPGGGTPLNHNETLLRGRRRRRTGPPSPPAPEARRPARRPSFRPEIQPLEPRISLSTLTGATQGPEIGGSNHNQTLLRGRRPRRTGPPSPPAPEARRPARRPSFRPEIQPLEPRISLSTLTGATQDPEIGGVNHNETLVISRPPRKRTEARRPARRPERPGFRPDVQRLEPRISLSGLCDRSRHGSALFSPCGS
jgi:hypothetical protein